jgi:hypothetical protein
LKKHFGQDLDDPLLYHMIINTDRIPYERAAQIIGEAVLAGVQKKECRPSAVPDSASP